MKVSSSTDRGRRTRALGFGGVTNKCGVGEEYIYFFLYKLSDCVSKVWTKLQRQNYKGFTVSHLSKRLEC